ncbi:MAG: 6-phosphogluconolactonase [Candidatus Thiodiazotropha sp. (ex Monitilora ramsayi)]|nr:6-phosphogluconolactonase [Candidatus Thiodiazotropha sp. (ex Monitilora ramsayi)]
MSGMRKVIEPEAFVDAATEWILRKIDSVLDQSNHCHLMLAGGSTPLPVYEQLATQNDILWHRITLYFGDERCVPPMTPESNAFTVISRLFPNGIPKDMTVHRMCGEKDPDEAAQAYEAILPARIDIMLLGIGEDGHTASIFPGSVALDEEKRRIMPVIGSKPPLQRLTITPRVIRDAQHLLVMVQGEDKADAVRWALNDRSVPAALAVDGDWLMDSGAARSLPEKRDKQGVVV